MADVRRAHSRKRGLQPLALVHGALTEGLKAARFFTNIFCVAKAEPKNLIERNRIDWGGGGLRDATPLCEWPAEILLPILRCPVHRAASEFLPFCEVVRL